MISEVEAVTLFPLLSRLIFFLGELTFGKGGRVFDLFLLIVEVVGILALELLLIVVLLCLDLRPALKLFLETLGLDLRRGAGAGGGGGAILA